MDLTDASVMKIFIEVLIEVAKIVGPIMIVAIVSGCRCKLLTNWLFIYN